MATRLIELQDGTLLEIEVPGQQMQQIAGSTADKIEATLEKIKPILVKACKPIGEIWKEMNETVYIEQAEVELGLSFEAEGNIYVTKAKANANLTVKLTLKPPKS